MAPSPGEFGCDYCANDEYRWFGHVTQVGSRIVQGEGLILLRCPRCNTLYENTYIGADRTRRLTEAEADQLYPGHD
jgi:hypothetical protein